MNIDKYKAVAIQAAQLSGEIIKKYFRNLTEIEIKTDESPVTIADKQAEELIRQIIRKNFPNHGIIGEEFAEENPDAEFKWIIEPIDGTKSYVAGFFDFGTIIGLLYQNEPIFSLVHQPLLNEIIIGDNSTASLNGKTISVRRDTQLIQATLLTTDYATIPNLERFTQLTKQVKQVRTWGNCYGHVMVALGYADIMIDPIMKFWDIAGIIPIIKGAGGVVSDYNGKNPINSSSLISCGSLFLQKAVLEYLS